MAVYGLTTDGLIIKTLEVIRAELSQRIKDTFGKSMKSDSDRSKLGQMVGIVSEIAALLWELGEAVNSSQDPDKATGAALDALCTLTGTFRPPATKSAVYLTLTGAPGTVVPAANKVQTSSTGVEFETVEAGTLVAVSAYVGAGGTAYALDDRVTNAGNVYQCTFAGTTDAGGASDPTTTDSEIIDGTVIWMYLGAGTAVDDVLAKAIEAGPQIANSGDITVINTAVAGWTGVINIEDASVGRDVASDEELRQLREAELAGPGTSPIDAIRADLLKLDDVVSVTVFVNNTDSTNSDGMPPHSVEALVRPTEIVPTGFDQAVWDTLLSSVAAGIVTTGNTPGTALDSQGTSHTMAYSRPEEVPIYVIVTLIKDADEYPTDGDDLIKDAIVAWGDELSCGKDAVASAIAAQAFTIDGVLDVSSVKIGLAPAPTLSATIPITLRQLATYSTANISVVSSDGTP
jgi:uncharacterized phage protein gp47/JayE